MAGAGGAFALLSPILGWLGVAVTGSDTSSNSLFGALQVQAATKAGLDPVLMAAANSSGGVLGKMVSPQNLAIAAAAVGMAGREGDIFRKVIGWSLLLLLLMCVIVALQATPVLSWMVPANCTGEVEREGRRTVQSVDRALALLEALAAAESPVGVGALAERTGLPQGTAHRLLQGLQPRGYVRHDASRKYSVGTAALLLSDAAQRSLARSARPYLAELVDASGETANLAVLEGDDVVYVAQVPSPHTLRMFAEVGRHVPTHSTAVGKVLLAGLPRERALSILQRTGLPASYSSDDHDDRGARSRARPSHRAGLGGRRGGAGGGRALCRGAGGRRPLGPGRGGGVALGTRGALRRRPRPEGRRDDAEGEQSVRRLLEPPTRASGWPVGAWPCRHGGGRP